MFLCCIGYPSYLTFLPSFNISAVERVWGGFRNQRTAVGKVFKYKAGQAPEKLTQLKAKSGKGVLDPEGIQKSPQL